MSLFRKIFGGRDKTPTTNCYANPNSKVSRELEAEQKYPTRRERETCNCGSGLPKYGWGACERCKSSRDGSRCPRCNSTNFSAGGSSPASWGAQCNSCGHRWGPNA